MGKNCEYFGGWTWNACLQNLHWFTFISLYMRVHHFHPRRMCALRPSRVSSPPSVASTHSPPTLSLCFTQTQTLPLSLSQLCPMYYSRSFHSKEPTAYILSSFLSVFPILSHAFLFFCPARCGAFSSLGLEGGVTGWLDRRKRRR